MAGYISRVHKEKLRTETCTEIYRRSGGDALTVYCRSGPVTLPPSLSPEHQSICSLLCLLPRRPHMNLECAEQGACFALLLLSLLRHGAPASPAWPHRSLLQCCGLHFLHCCLQSSARNSELGIVQQKAIVHYCLIFIAFAIKFLAVAWR